MTATPLLFFRSLVFALIFYSGTLLLVLATFVAALFGKAPMRGVVRIWAYFHRICARFLLGQKIRIVGAMPDEPALYVFKHESMFETIDLLCFFHYPMIAAKAELLSIPLWGWAARRYGMMEVRRDAGASALRMMRKDADKAFAEERPICLFPEGTRVPHGERPALKAGFAGLYKLLRLPVIPVAVDSGRVSPRQSFLKRPGIITYKVGETIPPGLSRAEAEARVHAAINALNPPAGDGLSAPE